ncbi:relaxase domain-containing protein [Streptomyces cyaneofuscatus]|uniref:relaxase domain-containing protein n=1 Tax=Streptomyces cyaneofuscatus TaxID=66883 RepID=UPI003669C22B
MAGVDSELIDWSATRRQQIEDVLEGLTYQYAQEHGRLPGEQARHGMGWWAAQDTRREKKTPRPLEQLLAWWKASALLKFGKQMVGGLLNRCRAAGAAIRARVDPHVDVMLAAVDVAAVVFTVRGKFARRHILAEARRHLLETLRGREFTRGLDDYIASRALSDHGRQTTDPQPDRQAPAADQIFYTADFTAPDPWFIAGTDGTPPRESSRYERARVASLAVRNAIRAARTASAGQADAPAATSAAARTDDQHHDPASSPPHAVDHPDRDATLTPAQQAAAIHAQQQAAMPEEYLGGRTTDAGTWLRTPKNLERLAAFTRASAARRRTYEDTKPPAALDAPAADGNRQEHEQQHQHPGHGQGPGPRP